MIVCYVCREPLHFEVGKGWVHEGGDEIIPNRPDSMGAVHRARPDFEPTAEEREKALEDSDLCTS